ncbi:MAG: response regulator [Candidatus Theseobacter exili]|nr:response regulator [Candidatus Theseobacter exili]
MNIEKKILIVDDEKTLCELYTEMLEEEGFQVFYAFNGQSALDIFKEKKPDLVLLDVKMPEMDGFEVLVRMKEINKNAAIVMMTCGAQDRAKEAAKLKAYDYIEKPTRLKDLMKIVTRRE